MQKDAIPYFSFKSSLEFEKKIYNLLITIFYNNRTSRKEYEVASGEFTGSTKLLVHSKDSESPDKAWSDINSLDDSPLIQEIGAVIFKHNV